MNKEFFKRYSTYANAISIILGAAMVYIPNMIPSGYVPYVMCACSVTVAICQVVKQNAK